MLDHNGYGYSTKFRNMSFPIIPDTQAVKSQESSEIAQCFVMLNQMKDEQVKSGDLITWLGQIFENSRNKDLPSKAESWSLPEKVVK